MRAINAAYRLLSDPRQRAAFDARRYLSVSSTPAARARYEPVPRRRTVVVATPPVSTPSAPLQRGVDRVVAILGILLLIGIGFYVINVIPYTERQYVSERRALNDRPGVTVVAPPETGLSSTAGSHVIGAPVPSRLSSDASLRSFPGTVLVAPTSLPPFSSLPVSRLDETGQGIARYAVYYGNLTTGSATIAGLVGRAAFDASVPTLRDCAPDAHYCAGQAPGQPVDGSPAGLELFREPDLVGDAPAFAVHRVCCNGVFWSVSWYEPAANMSYEIDLSRSIAALYGSGQVERDLASARAVAALAPQLVRLR